MAVTKELLQMDLYALLGIEEKAADKEVRTREALRIFGPRAWPAPGPGSLCSAHIYRTRSEYRPNA